MMPMPTAAAFFVTEEEYAKLQAACPRDFPYTYQQFVARLEQGIRDTPGVSVVKVNVNVDEFLAWCAETHVRPERTSRAHYAALLLHRQGLN
jgi:hypothetical protein